jgi:hypothetical protein
MNTDHISEDRIMEILDRTASMTNGETNHLHHCPLCKGIYLEYQGLYPQLEQANPIELPQDFSQRILDLLPPMPEARVKTSARLLWLGLGLMTIGLLVGLQAFYGLFTSLGGKIGPLSESISRQFSAEHSFFSLFSSESIHLLLYIPLCFGFVGLLDRLIRHRFHPLTRG